MIVIIKYNAGNTTSVLNAIENLGYPAIVSDDIDTIRNADKVIFPGVGEASTAMNYLQNKGLDVLIKSLKQPVLGICLGMQLLCESTEENATLAMGIFPVKVKRFPATLNVPHMGWNELKTINSALYKEVEINSDLYFVHSYYAEICNETTSICDYILPFSSSLEKDNFYATQFHPEKSAFIGQQILKNFLEL